MESFEKISRAPKRLGSHGEESIRGWKFIMLLSMDLGLWRLYTVPLLLPGLLALGNICMRGLPTGSAIF